LKQLERDGNLPICVEVMIKSFETLAKKSVRPKIYEFNSGRNCANWGTTQGYEIQFMKPTKAQIEKNLDVHTYCVCAGFKKSGSGLEGVSREQLIITPNLNSNALDAFNEPIVGFGIVSEHELRAAERKVAKG